MSPILQHLTPVHQAVRRGVDGAGDIIELIGTGGVVGIVIGVLIIVAAIAIGIFVYCARKRRAEEERATRWRSEPTSYNYKFTPLPGGAPLSNPQQARRDAKMTALQRSIAAGDYD